MIDQQEATEDGWFGALLLDQIERYLSRFVAYPSDHAVVAHVLWIVHTHLMDCWESTPRLAFLSAERGSGKTRALEVTGQLVPNAVQAINVTPAYLFRKVGDTEAPPTVLYDELDTLFGSKITDTGEVRALLNAGHRRGAVNGRCVVIGKRVETEEIPAYCAVALAGIDDLPDTIGSRAIIIDMRRRAPDERVEPFRARIHDGEGRNLRTMIEDWCAAVGASLRNAEPILPDGVVDRDADCWEALVAIADAAGGGEWPARARSAAVALVAGGANRTRTTGVQLLSDLRDIFGESEKLPTSTILEHLHGLPESPWKDVRGKPFDDRGLASRLSKYGVKPKKLRIHADTPRGYEAVDLRDAWTRYLPTPQRPEQAEQVEQPEHGTANGTQDGSKNGQKLQIAPGVPDVPVNGGTPMFRIMIPSRCSKTNP
jgi:Protein of unknown function (DUF3631)